VYSPVLSVPAPRVSGWVAETDPKYARPWLESLPLANNAEAAREIYQALYTLNRVDLKVQTRSELMALYEPVVATVCNGLQSYLLHSTPPLGPKKAQLAELIRRLHVEMAYGYKCCLRDLSRARVLLRRKLRSALCIERALHHLSEVLLRSYLVYLPYPNSIWRETHELYRLAESLDVVDDTLASTADSSEPSVSIGERYVRTLLMGLANPYQLAHNVAQQLHTFVAHWAKQANVRRNVDAKDATGCFWIDLTADAPPVPLTKKNQEISDSARVLDARPLLKILQRLVARLDAGEPVEKLKLGIDCLDSTCADLLRRMSRALGEGARRRYARRQRSSNVFVCVGLNAIHFFATGQRPFATYLHTFPWFDRPGRLVESPDVAFIELEEENTATNAFPLTEDSSKAATESHRVDRWQLRDIGPQGMSLARYGDASTPVRVGELIGIQQPSDLGRWRAAAIRWIKSPEPNSVEVGVELLAPTAVPVAMRLPGSANAAPGLSLPATEVTRRPATLLLARGSCEVGDELEVIDEESGARRVRVLRLVERTGAFEQIVPAEVSRR
jgi:cyclic-di-GMP-binding protein